MGGVFARSATLAGERKGRSEPDISRQLTAFVAAAMGSESSETAGLSPLKLLSWSFILPLAGAAVVGVGTLCRKSKFRQHQAFVSVSHSQ